MFNILEYSTVKLTDTERFAIGYDNYLKNVMLKYVLNKINSIR